MPTPLGRPAPAPLARDRERGFSLIEVLVASLLLLFIALGIIPIFVMAMRSNVAGQDHTLAANHARARIEQLMQVPFNDPLLTISTGTERAWTERYDEATDAWVLLVGDPPAGTNWLRHTTVRQFDVEELTDANADNRDPIPISADDAEVNPTSVQIKEIKVEVFSPRIEGFMAAKEMTLTTFKAG